MAELNPSAPPRSGGPFEIGLVLSGGVSAGAYTAGVVDFLIQALDAFQEAKASRDPNCPDHDVRLRVISGASAGGMTAALSAGILFENFQNAVDSTTIRPRNNTLFDAWVNQIDATEFLSLSDLKLQREVPSILNSTVLSGIASRAFEFEVFDNPPVRSYVADPLEILLTVTNLRGVPYAVNFAGCPANIIMTLHADWMHFAVGNNCPADKVEIISLKPRQYRSEGWDTLREAAIATGAFPFGLAPRSLRRSSRDIYANRFTNISPCWPEGMLTEYLFQCVDGGVIDNSPMTLARQVLARHAGVNRREGQISDHALILVEAFPSTAEFVRSDDFQGRPDLFALAGRLVATLLNQARFKYDDLQSAEDPAVFNRFMIAPLRRQGGDQGTPADYPLACGSLGGFGGFLDRDFRRTISSSAGETASGSSSAISRYHPKDRYGTPSSTPGRMLPDDDFASNVRGTNISRHNAAKKVKCSCRSSPSWEMRLDTPWSCNPGR